MGGLTGEIDEEFRKVTSRGRRRGFGGCVGREWNLATIPFVVFKHVSWYSGSATFSAPSKRMANSVEEGPDARPPCRTYHAITFMTTTVKMSHGG